MLKLRSHPYVRIKTSAIVRLATRSNRSDFKRRFTCHKPSGTRKVKAMKKVWKDVIRGVRFALGTLPFRELRRKAALGAIAGVLEAKILVHLQQTLLDRGQL